MVDTALLFTPLSKRIIQLCNVLNALHDFTVLWCMAHLFDLYVYSAQILAATWSPESNSNNWAMKLNDLSLLTSEGRELFYVEGGRERDGAYAKLQSSFCILSSLAVRALHSSHSYVHSSRTAPYRLPRHTSFFFSILVTDPLHSRTCFTCSLSVRPRNLLSS